MSDEAAELAGPSTLGTYAAGVANGEVVGKWDDGVLTGRDGRVLAVLELATSSLCPDNFAATTLRACPRRVAAHHGQGTRQSGPRADELPVEAVSEWSDADPLQCIRGY